MQYLNGSLNNYMTWSNDTVIDTSTKSFAKALDKLLG